MSWILEKLECPAWTAKYGSALHDIGRHDPYEFTCVIEDRGDGIAYVSHASGAGGRIPERAGLRRLLIDLGFERVRWIRVVDEVLCGNGG